METRGKSKLFKGSQESYRVEWTDSQGDHGKTFTGTGAIKRGITYSRELRQAGANVTLTQVVRNE